jgi:serine phosphatase RsbU (regulator of sigma subunit)/PAS domain-containing protein
MNGRGRAGDVTERTGADVARLSAVVARQREELDRLRSEAAGRSAVDLARGMLMEQLRCSPAEAAEQLSRLAGQAGDSVAGLAAQITGQPLSGEAEDPGLRLAAHTVGELGTQVPGGDQAASHRSFWVFGLLDGLLDGFLFARPVRGADGEVADFRIDHVSSGFRGPAGQGGAELTGRRLLETYPEAALSGGLFDSCLAALQNSGLPPVAGETVARQRVTSGAAPVSEVRIVPLHDGVAIAWRGADEADRLAALLQHAQRLGRIGGWEENLLTGEVHWTQPTFALFGQEDGDPVSTADLHARVPADDVPAVQRFRDTLLAEHRESAAAFRVVRSDDGSVRQMRAYAEPVTDPGGAVIAIRGAYQDVSADYHTRLAFAATRERLADTEERAEEEHRLAMRLQQAITPRSPEPVAAAGLDVVARYRPAGPGSLVSGDWYDTVLLPSKDVLVVVGDIAGHGLDAVTGMVAVRNGLRGLSITGAGPATLLGWLNGAACHFADGIIGTAVCGLYDPASRSLRWARAGHLPPILVHHGVARALSLPQGLLLGADPDAPYAEMTTPLQLGDTLLLFTDGLIERRDRPIDDALDSLLRIASRPVGDIGRYADEVVADAASNTDDDACLVVVHVR